MKLLMAVLALFMIVGCSSEPTKPVETERSGTSDRANRLPEAVRRRPRLGS